MSASTSSVTYDEKVALFLKAFVPLWRQKTIQANKASWLLETTGAQDAADLRADLDAELRILFQDAHTYSQLAQWQTATSDPLLKRQANILYRAFKGNQIPQPLLIEMAQLEAKVGLQFATFRPRFEGKPISDGDLKEIFRHETNVARRQAAWDASKEVGVALAPDILRLVDLRNQAAQAIGAANYFEMQLELQEVDPKWLQGTFDDLAHRSAKAYRGVVAEVEEGLKKRFGASGPWGWGDPFCQEDPLDVAELDSLCTNLDLEATATRFYAGCGFDVAPILRRSDNYERQAKCPHAFCTHIDREGDVRTLNNLKPTIKWLETLLHELGHAVYDLGYAPNLPWVLREPPHMITTEAMALLAGRQAYHMDSLRVLVPTAPQSLLLKAESSLRRRQLIFSRWVFVMTAFERELYRNPRQDLNALWWKLVQEHQCVQPHNSRAGKADWAAKYHIACAPVYYFSYLIGELLASALQDMLKAQCGASTLTKPEVGRLLTERLFAPGNRMNWSDLSASALDRPLTGEPWLQEFC